MSRHDELEREQAHIDRAYEALDRLREGAAATAPAPVGDDEGAGGTFQDRFQRERATADARRRLGELRWGDPPLVFGRIDLTEPVDGDDRFHVGRIGVFAEDQTQLVVDWRAPIAEGFYRATRAEPMGIHRRRAFHCRGRRLLDLDDVVLDPAGGGDDALVGEAALLASLAAPRTGRMSDAVATVQAEQDEVIRAPMAGITIVQGAAGTGKTIVALHRAAYLLYTFRDVLDRQGVLLLGPNARFLDYVRDVLPALGEHDARLATVHDLFPGVRAVPDTDVAAATVKADLRMAQVLRRAVRMRQRRVRDTVVVPVGRFLLKLDPAVVNRIVESARRLDGAHNDRRRFVEADLVDALYAELRRRNTAKVDRMRDPGRDGLRHLLRRTPAYVELLERVWPLLRPQDLLHDLFGSRAMLRHAGRDGVLDDAQQELLHRPRAPRADDVVWTHADVPLLHEAHALLGALPRPPAGSAEPTEDEQFLVDRVMEHVAASMASMQQGLDAVMEADLRRSVLDEIRTDTGAGDDLSDQRTDVRAVWGTVLVDEAQDLSPMAWRMVARSCPNQAMTIVGDLAQGTAPWSPGSWDEVVGWIGPRHPARRHELHVNYRTPRELMAVAAPFSTAPGRARAVRSSGHPPRAVAVRPDALAGAAAERARAMRAEVPEGRVAVIAAPELVEEVRQRAGEQVEAHTPETVKGLEFDGVVVVEPVQLVREPAGTAPLYIALTRSTALLELVHAEPLPGPLAEHLAATH